MGVVCAEGGRIIHGNPAGRAGLENRKPFLENPLTICIIVAGRMNFVGIPQGLRASFLRGIRLKKPHKIDLICRAIVSAFFAVGLVVLMRSMIDQMESKGTAHTSSTSISPPLSIRGLRRGVRETSEGPSHRPLPEPERRALFSRLGPEAQARLDVLHGLLIEAVAQIPEADGGALLPVEPQHGGIAHLPLRPHTARRVKNKAPCRSNPTQREKRTLFTRTRHQENNGKTRPLREGPDCRIISSRGAASRPLCRWV